jgi:cyclopropane fatty-acyl-phospholipid synthase-like methyltransferase
MEGFLKIQEILDEVDLSANTVVADFGCGSGGWVIPLAKLLVDGRVFAIDVLEEPLSALKSRAKQFALTWKAKMVQGLGFLLLI